jgi:hypothetical protein
MMSNVSQETLTHHAETNWDLKEEISNAGKNKKLWRINGNEQKA